ncbi:ArnT family glycosyltransferase [Thermodesulfobacteriota bacterium]
MKKPISYLIFIALGVILIFGSYLRFEYISRTQVINPLRKDAKLYLMYAYNWRHKHIYSKEIGNPYDLNSPVKPDSLCTPGYPLFLTPFVGGPPTDALLGKILFSQAIISVLALGIAFLFFQSFLSRIWAVLATLLVALSPHLITASGYLLTETLFCFFLVGFGFLMSLLLKSRSYILSVLIGIAMGAANLVKPSLQYFPIVMLFFLVFHFGRKEGFKLFLGILLGFFLIISPWIARNWITMGGESNVGLKINFLHHGMYPDFMFEGKPESYGYPYHLDPRTREITTDIPSVLKEIARRFHLEPYRHLKWYLWKKPLTFWSWSLIQGNDVFVYPILTCPYFHNKAFQWTHLIMYISHPFWVWAAMCGSLLAWLPFSGKYMSSPCVLTARFVSIVLIYFTLIHMVGTPFPRYSVPLRPFMYGMALFLLHLVTTALKKEQPEQSKTSEIQETLIGKERLPGNP